MPNLEKQPHFAMAWSEKTYAVLRQKQILLNGGHRFNLQQQVPGLIESVNLVVVTDNAKKRQRMLELLHSNQSWTTDLNQLTTVLNDPELKTNHENDVFALVKVDRCLEFCKKNPENLLPIISYLYQQLNTYILATRVEIANWLDPEDAQIELETFFFAVETARVECDLLKVFFADLVQYQKAHPLYLEMAFTPADYDSLSEEEQTAADEHYDRMLQQISDDMDSLETAINRVIYETDKNGAIYQKALELQEKLNQL